MKYIWPGCSKKCALAAVVALAQLFMPFALAQTLDSKAALETRVRELEKTQRRLLEKLKKDREEASAAPAIEDEDLARQRQEIDKSGREIEQRIAAQENSRLYFTPSTVATAEMRAYYERLAARLEDCGTRYTLKRRGKSVYGKGVVSIELDHGGNAVTMRIEKSSADKLIDNHMLKLIVASSPFGPTPERVLPQDTRRYESIVVFTAFKFTRDNKPVKPVEARERCRMK